MGLPSDSGTLMVLPWCSRGVLVVFPWDVRVTSSAIPRGSHGTLRFHESSVVLP